MEKKYMYKTKGTCSSEIYIEMEGDLIKKVNFYGGCSGNTQGVARLSEGKNASEVIEILKGIRCGFKKTSCPDQLATALEMILADTSESEGEIRQLNF